MVVEEAGDLLGYAFFCSLHVVFKHLSIHLSILLKWRSASIVTIYYNVLFIGYAITLVAYNIPVP